MVTVRGYGVPVYCNCMMRLYQQILQNHLAKKRKKYYTLDMLANAAICPLCRKQS